ncbi:tRNA (adenosine(37)-N6)-threonylcarbamoyltransferase complex dimerization subunit type 1 TsaB [Mycoplasma sp. T363T]|uniref:tRNA (Adenosine(37)-N6)-threonylcarbamoyltransferase complex dimerization subunit type 1 TsaB n=1 Tax=Mycoplasma bradburyae TaxID=2963128 RepID=A0AAW6HS55_9MOLU|nr:tRNA (adenosine(37)-N6)-threonylcarbamoyltransferase complex dimerization subunit type 1 TsaB [Mycoplasma bradburyae]MDC4163527.1 tRNA (adenosine(37)-N6)-threonylcarbamoyltransferase complex dimerization subunit type 1 TsaB [Mycoplasma bradburyae]MDC4182125.1 tRNA (adenosine(37)-N6)-threonylcarbamoyltransferase complex dimerization subunit type 1 TsaB [Mycoplasma bradburyae]MDC4182890.1 tRNA (adenosine(37)-N6)-threonylcarbamoyltransferase complex dimerization subunit type 1 TsaB [Mycoplasma b
MRKLCLFIDTCLDKINLAIFDNEKEELYNYTSIEINKNLVDIVVERIDDFLKQSKVKKKAIKKLYITVGPGSFSGVRVGTNIAKTWKTVDPSVEVYTISTLKIQVPYGDGISCLDAKSNKQFVSIYRGNVGNIKIVDHEEYENMCKKNTDLSLFKNFANVDIFENLINNISNFELTEIEDIKPIYLKDPL